MILTNKPVYSILQDFVRYTGRYSAAFDRVEIETNEIIGFQLNLCKLPEFSAPHIHEQVNQTQRSSDIERVRRVERQRIADIRTSLRSSSIDEDLEPLIQ
jgi:hypothetical protein